MFIAESNQENICAQLELIFMDWAQMLAEDTFSMSSQKWLIGCQLWSLTISWETQCLCTVSQNAYLQGKQKAVESVGKGM